MNRRSLARLVAALGLAAAVALGTAGPAGAQPAGPDVRNTMAAQFAPPPDAGTEDTATQNPDPRTTNPGPPSGTPDPRVTTTGLPAPDAAAPTENLRKLANALVVQNKGIYLKVSVPAGLNVGPIEISIGYGGERFTRNYNNASPAEYTLDFPPLTGAARQEYVAITLTERVPGGPHHYAIVSQVDVVPLYTVTTSALRFAAGGDCDPLNGQADPTIAWVDPAGVQHRVGRSHSDVTLDEFRGNWTGVDVNRGLTVPTIAWVDRDPGGITIPRSYSLPRGEQLLPFPASYPNNDTVVHEITDTLDDIGGDCSAQVRYTITYAPEGTTI